MPRRVLFSLAALFLIVPLAVAQPMPGDPKEETVETVDGVKLRCRFYRAAKEGNGACAILMTDYGATGNEAEWDGLARYLATDVGINVVRFDWRGHGGSKEVIAERFWGPLYQSWNGQRISGSLKKRGTIDYKDFDSRYYPMLVNDLAAVRNLLDLKSDRGEVNTRSVYLIASGSSAPLAMLFLATEWSRAQTKPNPMGVAGNVVDLVSFGGRRNQNTEVAGKDYAGLVLLSPTNAVVLERGGQKTTHRIPDATVRDFVSRYGRDVFGNTGDLRSGLSMLVFAGDKDKAGIDAAEWYYRDLMNAEKKTSTMEPMKNTKLIVLKNCKESGADLLGKMNTLRTEEIIKGFIEKVESDRKKLNPIERKYEKPFRINLASFGIN